MRQDIGALVALLAVLAVTSCNGAKQVHQGASSFGPRRVIDSAIGPAGDVLAHDLDGDGDLDVLCVAESISWYENLDGHGRFGGARHVLEDARLATTAAVADIDGDGDLDVATADVPAWRSGRLVWFANDAREGRRRFGEEREISRRSVYPGWIVLDDLDGDGDADAVAAIGSRDNTLAWFENHGGGRFSSAPRMTKKVRASAVVAEDLDDDGAPDLLLAGSSSMHWYRNEVGAVDGRGGFGPPRELTRAHGAFSLTAADLDSDGDPDVLAGTVDGPLGLSGGGVAWYENLDGHGHFDPEPKLTVAMRGGAWVSAADLDGDGDLDVFAAVRRSMGAGGVVWYANVDGRGRLGPALMISTEPLRSDAATAADLDGDGDLDVLAAYRPSPFQGILAWYENQLSNPSEQGSGPRR